jgi:hypothetical protein
MYRPDMEATKFERTSRKIVKYAPAPPARNQEHIYPATN